MDRHIVSSQRTKSRFKEYTVRFWFVEHINLSM